MAADKATAPGRPQLAVSAAIFRDGRVLVVRRARRPALGLYSVPGGRVEFGETLTQAAQREVREETGLAIAIAGLAGWREVLPDPARGSTGHYVILSFAARWVSGDVVLNDELDDARWLDPDVFAGPGPAGLPTTEGLTDIIRSAHALVR
jgi:8-oxo-dGTP diphosphatase